MTPSAAFAVAIMPFGSIYSCSCAPVSYSPSTTTSAAAIARVDVPARHEVVLEDVVASPDDRPASERVVDGEDRGLGFDVHPHVPARFLERVAVGMREKHDGLLRMVDAIGGQTRLVVEDECDAIGAGNVSGGNDHEVRPGDAGLELDALDEAAGHGASDRGPNEHPRQREVVDVLRPASDLGRTFAARDGLAQQHGQGGDSILRCLLRAHGHHHDGHERR